MKVVALISGGKDSCFNIMQCIAAGHEIVALANLYPVGKDELDSYMFQTVGHQGVEFIGEAMGLPLYREPTFGKSKMKEKHYLPTVDDEVEDLFRLLKTVKDREDIQAVASGAILSDYQRIRVENVCSRLELVSLSYLWRRDQEQLLNEMIECSVNAVLIKVASLGLEPRHLGKSISEMQPHLAKMKEKYGLNICGEGGEYETFTLDCPLYIKSIVIDEYESIVHSNDEVAPAGYLNFKKIHLQNKNSGEEKLTLQERLKNVAVKASFDYISEIVEPDFQDECNLSDDENDDLAKDNRDLIISNSGKCNLASMMKITCKEEEYFNTPSINKNQTGWHWFGNIIGKNVEPKLAMAEALDGLIDLVKKEDLEISDIVAVTIFLKDLSSYADINEVYVSRLVKVNPPVRVCTEIPINCHVVLDALAYKKVEKDDRKKHKKHTMHVQSISHWAPANIGPYSHAIRIGDIISVAGQIPLVPGNMNILDSSIKRQCRLTLRHINRIVKAMDSNTELRHIVQGICFLTHPSFISSARKEWEKRTNNAIVDYVVVSSLPRGAQVEWCVWAHRDNNRFEYEETGKCVGNFKVAIRRRWNYENNVSAIVCYLSTGPSNSTGKLTVETNTLSANLTMTEFVEIFEYFLCKLTKDSRTHNPPCNLRIFYKIGSLSGPNFIQKALIHFKNRNLVTTVIPTHHLYNYSTFLSVCGIRQE
ncbi:PREDICTED: diphthine--ammonia ligase [Ceratosolen solmsi marchali]|uniref:Diphthine--ammonia ligase n=1 Tax=Ceratosolen solmsi marchali TaxID=326594 RepID=A0AAJ7DUQ1_9HYME|nr:PREDICTED: diphthine--ammonia ligase [Ceratosolen solmsi marchali]